MSLSRDEARQLRGIAEFLRGNPSPAMLEQIAGTLDTLLEEGARRAPLDVRQCALPLAVPASAMELHTAAPVQRTELHISAPVQHADDVSSTCDAVESAPAAPSSSSLGDLSLKKKKKTERVRPCTDDPLPDELRAAYDEVVAERKVKLPSAEFLWAKFVERLWAKDLTYSTKYCLKRKWRSWVWYEQPLEDPAVASCRPTEAFGPRSGPRLASTYSGSSQAELERQERERAPASVAMLEASKLAHLFSAPPPAPRSMSA